MILLAEGCTTVSYPPSWTRHPETGVRQAGCGAFEQRSSCESHSDEESQEHAEGNDQSIS